MKKILSFLLALTLVFSLFSMCGITASAYTSGYYTYTVSNGEATITDCVSSISGDVTIPSTLGGYPVTGVDNWTFGDCNNITSITIPENITYLGGYLFYENNSLRTINFNAINCETTTEPFAIFYSCSNLTTINIGKNVTKIPKQAFVSNDKITELTIPENVTYIGNEAFGFLSGLKVVNFNATNCEYAGENYVRAPFEECENLKTINIGNNVEKIPANTFAECKVLEKIVIPSNVIEIGEDAFLNCERLIDITVPDSVKRIAENAFYGTAYFKVKSSWQDGALYIGKHLIGCDISDWSVWEDTFVVKSGTKTIASNAFDEDDYSNWRIKKITIPKSIVSISEDATIGLSNLEEVYYLGSKSDKSKISIEAGNILLEYANWNYNSCIKSAKHTYDNSCDKTCDVCGVTRTVSNHKYSNACDKTCNVCSKTRTVPSHKYSNACDKSCNVCKATRKVPAHKYTNKCDTTCNVCNAKRTITHSYKTTTTVKATSTKNGKIVKKCSVCKNAITTTIKSVKTIKLGTKIYTYNGKVKSPSIIIKDSAGKALKKNTDYTVKYLTNRKNVGVHNIKITFKGKYSGSKTLSFTINPATTKVSKVTAGKKSLTVSVAKKTTQVTGYQIQYSTSKKFTSAKTKTITSYKTTKATIKGLKAKKTYYVRVRTYKTVSGKKFYSAWSSAKSKKTK